VPPLGLDSGGAQVEILAATTTSTTMYMTLNGHACSGYNECTAAIYSRAAST
jgi:hypothetical protein